MRKKNQPKQNTKNQQKTAQQEPTKKPALVSSWTQSPQLSIIPLWNMVLFNDIFLMHFLFLSKQKYYCQINPNV